MGIVSNVLCTILYGFEIEEGMADALVVDIVEKLEERGLSRYAFQLHDSVDPDALERVVESLEGEFSMTLTIEGIEIEITEEGVQVVSVPDHGENHPDEPLERSEVDAINAVIEMLTIESRGALFEAATDFLHRKLDADMTKVAVARDDLLVPVASTNGGNTGNAFAIPIDTTIPGSVFRTGAGCNIGNFHAVRGETDSSDPTSGPTPDHPGVDHRSMVCAPVGELGVLVGLRREPNSFDDDDLAITAAVGRLLALIAPTIEADSV